MLRGGNLDEGPGSDGLLRPAFELPDQAKVHRGEACPVARFGGVRDDLLPRRVGVCGNGGCHRDRTDPQLFPHTAHDLFCEHPPLKRVLSVAQLDPGLETRGDGRGRNADCEGLQNTHSDIERVLPRAPLIRLLDVELIGATLPLPRGLVLLELGGECLVLVLDNSILEVPALVVENLVPLSFSGQHFAQLLCACRHFVGYQERPVGLVSRLPR